MCNAFVLKISVRVGFFVLWEAINNNSYALARSLARTHIFTTPIDQVIRITATDITTTSTTAPAPPPTTTTAECNEFD